MKRTPRTLLWILAFLIAASILAGEGVPAASFTERAKRTKERIDFLFRHRSDEPVKISPDQNPFRLSTDAPVVAASSTLGQPIEMEPALPTTDEALLRQAVATLKIGGTLLENTGQINLTINKESYKEGGIITTRVQGKSVYLHIRRITLSSVTFSYNEAEFTQNF